MSYRLGRALSKTDGGSPIKFLVLKGKQTMKRVLGITLALLSLGFVVPAAEAAEVSNQNSTVTAAANSAPQWQRDRYGRRYNNRRRSVTTVTTGSLWPTSLS